VKRFVDLYKQKNFLVYKDNKVGNFLKLLTKTKVLEWFFVFFIFVFVYPAEALCKGGLLFWCFFAFLLLHHCTLVLLCYGTIPIYIIHYFLYLVNPFAISL